MIPAEIPWTNADKINLAIAIGTCVAAASSLIAAFIALWTSRKAEKLAQRNALEEKNRWLIEILFSLANQCNLCVAESGKIMPTEGNVSRMITILCNAIDLIKREKHKDNRDGHLKNLWIFIHSSIWVEIDKGSVFKSLDSISPEGRATLSGQYEKVRTELLSKVI